jgi:hypothetical protein
MSNEKNVKLEVIKAVSIADMTIKLLMKTKDGQFGYSNSEIAEMIRKATGSNTSPACVAWYRSHMKNKSFAQKHGIVNYIPVIAKRQIKEITISIESPK